jgi:hypothetical protein
MIEVILKDYLDDIFDCPVLLEKPDNPSTEYIMLERTGDMTIGVCVHDATIAFQTCAATLYRSAEMAEELTTALEDAPVIDDITSVEVNSVYNFSDRLTKEYRYQVVANITYYKGDTNNG